MARMRTLKPEFFRDRLIGKLGSRVASVYQVLWCMADDGGTAPCDPDRMKGEMFYTWPEMTQRVLMEAIHRLAVHGRLDLYRVGDETFAKIRTFPRHQKPQRPSAFRYPTSPQLFTPDEWMSFVQGSMSPHGVLSEPSTSVVSSQYSVDSRKEQIASAAAEVISVKKEPAPKITKPGKPAVAGKPLSEGGGPSSSVDKTNWVIKALKIWEPIGLRNPGEMGKQLKPAVDKYGWDKVEPWLKEYVRNRPFMIFGRFYGDDPKDYAKPPVRNLNGVSPADFVQTISTWENLCKPIDPPKLTLVSGD